ncbi:hypothetical protein DIPPA_18733 [Diplonema papillatum]|nr:hypothetical protein DIPPA_18733 [Diplonema papillatum]
MADFEFFDEEPTDDAAAGATAPPAEGAAAAAAAAPAPAAAAAGSEGHGPFPAELSRFEAGPALRCLTRPLPAPRVCESAAAPQQRGGGSGFDGRALLVDWLAIHSILLKSALPDHVVLSAATPPPELPGEKPTDSMNPDEQAWLNPGGSSGGKISAKADLASAAGQVTVKTEPPAEKSKAGEDNPTPPPADDGAEPLAAEEGGGGGGGGGGMGKNNRGKRGGGGKGGQKRGKPRQFTPAERRELLSAKKSQLTAAEHADVNPAGSETPSEWTLDLLQQEQHHYRKAEFDHAKACSVCKETLDPHIHLNHLFILPPVERAFSVRSRLRGAQLIKGFFAADNPRLALVHTVRKREVTGQASAPDAAGPEPTLRWHKALGSAGAALTDLPEFIRAIVPQKGACTQVDPRAAPFFSAGGAAEPGADEAAEQHVSISGISYLDFPALELEESGGQEHGANGGGGGDGCRRKKTVRCEEYERETNRRVNQRATVPRELRGEAARSGRVKAWRRPMAGGESLFNDPVVRGIMRDELPIRAKESSHFQSCPPIAFVLSPSAAAALVDRLGESVHVAVRVEKNPSAAPKAPRLLKYVGAPSNHGSVRRRAVNGSHYRHVLTAHGVELAARVQADAEQAGSPAEAAEPPAKKPKKAPEVTALDGWDPLSADDAAMADPAATPAAPAELQWNPSHAAQAPLAPPGLAAFTYAYCTLGSRGLLVRSKCYVREQGKAVVVRAHLEYNSKNFLATPDDPAFHFLEDLTESEVIKAYFGAVMRDQSVRHVIGRVNAYTSCLMQWEEVNPTTLDRTFNGEGCGFGEAAQRVLDEVLDFIDKATAEEGSYYLVLNGTEMSLYKEEEDGAPDSDAKTVLLDDIRKQPACYANEHPVDYVPTARAFRSHQQLTPQTFPPANMYNMPGLFGHKNDSVEAISSFYKRSLEGALRVDPRKPGVSNDCCWNVPCPY